jgi:chemotaxis protein methyltransferase CheR
MKMLQPETPALYEQHSKLAINDNDFELIRNWIYEVAGITLTPAKKNLVTGRLGKRVQALGYSTFGDYIRPIIAARAGDSAAIQERQFAINALTTNETYFFREPAHFDFLKDVIIPQWQGGEARRIWSAASSSGEEAYTAAMVLTMSLPQVRWDIVGTDINSEVVAHAGKALYPLSRAEKIPSQYLKAYCLKGIGKMEGLFQITPKVKSRVSFQTANITQEQTTLGRFDLIMLRNVLIYFDKASKQRVINNLINRLKPGGYLFIGHAESLNGLDYDLKMIKTAIYQRPLEK